LEKSADYDGLPPRIGGRIHVQTVRQHWRRFHSGQRMSRLSPVSQPAIAIPTPTWTFRCVRICSSLLCLQLRKRHFPDRDTTARDIFC
jgi:hypothetical protein